MILILCFDGHTLRNARADNEALTRENANVKAAAEAAEGMGNP